MLSARIVSIVMPQVESGRMLTDDELRSVDQTILSYLVEGRVTPIYCKKRLEEDGHDYSRGYVHERLARLVEHDHVENLMKSGLYELVEDPRSG